MHISERDGEDSVKSDIHSTERGPRSITGPLWPLASSSFLSQLIKGRTVPVIHGPTCSPVSYIPSPYLLAHKYT